MSPEYHNQSAPADQLSQPRSVSGGNSPALGKLIHPKICFIDLETTGLNPNRHGIWQIAAVLTRVEGGKIHELASFESLVCPFKNDVLDPEALGMKGYAPESFESFPQPPAVLRQFKEVLGQYCDKLDRGDKFFFAAYNASFDYRFLRRFFEKLIDPYFGSWFFTPPVDIMGLAAISLLNERPDMENFKLSTVAKKCGYQLDDEHDAMADVRATKAVFEFASSRIADSTNGAVRR
jgi:DNA polymerase III subunit epsilon